MGNEGGTVQVRVDMDNAGIVTFWFDGSEGFNKTEFVPGSVTRHLMNTIESKLDELVEIWENE